MLTTRLYFFENCLFYITLNFEILKMKIILNICLEKIEYPILTFININIIWNKYKHLYFLLFNIVTKFSIVWLIIGDVIAK